MTDPGDRHDQGPLWTEGSGATREPTDVAMAVPTVDEQRTRITRLRWAVATGGAATVVGIGAFAAAAALASGPTRTPADAAAAATQQNVPLRLSPVLPLPAGVGGGPLDAGADGLASLPTIRSIGSGSITVSGPGGRTITFDTVSSTKYERDGATVARSALAVGQHVSVRPAMPVRGPWGPPRSAAAPSLGSTSSALPSSGAPKLTVAVVDIVDPSIAGTVKSVHDGTIVVADGQGFWRTIRTSAATTYMLGLRAASASSLMVGEQVVATGRIDSDHTDLDATVVRVVLPTAAGRVTSVKGGTIVLQGFGQQTVTVHTDSSTVYRDASGTTTASAVKVGDIVVVQGNQQSGGTWLADSVVVGPAQAAGLPGPFGGPGGGFGPPRGTFHQRIGGGFGSGPPSAGAPPASGGTA